MDPTVEWKDGAVRLLDQSRLPESVEFLDCRDYQTVADSIRSLKVRGAPAIGVTAAMGVALGAQAVMASDYEAFAKAVEAEPETTGKVRALFRKIFARDPSAADMDRGATYLAQATLAEYAQALLSSNEVIFWP